MAPRGIPESAEIRISGFGLQLPSTNAYGYRGAFIDSVSKFGHFASAIYIFFNIIVPTQLLAPAVAGKHPVREVHGCAGGKMHPGNKRISPGPQASMSKSELPGLHPGNARINFVAEKSRALPGPCSSLLMRGPDEPRPYGWQKARNQF